MSKQCLDVQQIQHLQEVGLKLKETMLYWVVYEDGHENNFVTTKENAMEVIDESCVMLPAYTLQDVLDALPKEISKDGCTWHASLYIDFENNRIAYGVPVVAKGYHVRARIRDITHWMPIPKFNPDKPE